MAIWAVFYRELLVITRLATCGNLMKLGLTWLKAERLLRPTTPKTRGEQSPGAWPRKPTASSARRSVTWSSRQSIGIALAVTQSCASDHQNYQWPMEYPYQVDIVQKCSEWFLPTISSPVVCFCCWGSWCLAESQLTLARESWNRCQYSLFLGELGQRKEPRKRTVRSYGPYGKTGW